MSITYTWKINKFDCCPEVDNKKDVVSTIHWSIFGTDGIHETNIYSSTGVTLNPEDEFIPFSELTQEKTIEWIESILGPDQVATLQQSLDKRIEDINNPPIITMPVPWVDN